ncbi:hypothetical protein SAMN04487943_102350 [Gracilibacillus orientalis]|uniref:DUF4181 domain-containing protein n=1 Tax=Gracilibacillus orientalis TaxID=334253 RepID=A0A1I4IYB3_9BACI|nr:hypothetical protein [Gracilibacillus orientalis]SFL59017.1 hypothetical protein SAMN04487943_102350 [Gracilibacillus orientalis]
MIKENVIEYLFNEKKYKVAKNVCMLIFWLTALLLTINLSDSFQVYRILFMPVLVFLLILELIKMNWYNKKMDIKTSVKEWIGVVIMILTIIAVFYLDNV